jgi:hypothetical protein
VSWFRRAKPILTALATREDTTVELRGSVPTQFQLVAILLLGLLEASPTVDEVEQCPGGRLPTSQRQARRRGSAAVRGRRG